MMDPRLSVAPEIVAGAPSKRDGQKTGWDTPSWCVRSRQGASTSLCPLPCLGSQSLRRLQIGQPGHHQRERRTTTGSDTPGGVSDPADFSLVAQLRRRGRRRAFKSGSFLHVTCSREQQKQLRYFLGTERNPRIVHLIKYFPEMSEISGKSPASSGKVITNFRPIFPGNIMEISWQFPHSRKFGGSSGNFGNGNMKLSLKHISVPD